MAGNLEGVLARIPGYGGYLAKQRFNEQSDESDMQQARGLQGLMAQFQQQQESARLKSLLEQSGGDVEAATAAAVKSGNIKAAHDLAPLVRLQQERKQREETPRLLADLNRQMSPQAAPAAPVQAAQVAPDIPVANPADAMVSTPNAGGGGSVAAGGSVDPRQARIAHLTALTMIPQYANNPIVQQRLQAEIDKLTNVRPMVEHQFSVGENQVQPHISFDEGKSWQPIPGSKPSSKFAKQVVDGAAAAPIIQPQHADKHGADFLATLPVADQSIVKGLAEYRINPATLSNKGGHRERMLALASQTNPDYDQTQYSSRQKVRSDFTSGVTAKNVTAINTAIGHIGSLDELGDALDSGNIKAVNQAVNAISSRFSNPNLNNVRIAQSAVGDELMRVFRQVGASKEESDAWKQKFDAANTPAERKGAVKTAGELLKSRIDALNDQWNRGMGTDTGFKDLLSPKSQAVMGKVSKYGAKAGPADGGGWSMRPVNG